MFSQLPKAWPSAGSYGTFGMFGVRVQSTVSQFLLDQTLGTKVALAPSLILWPLHSQQTLSTTVLGSLHISPMSSLTMSIRFISAILILG